MEAVYSFLVALADISLRKTGVEEKRSKVLKESKILLDFTRKAIARLTYLKRYIFRCICAFKYFIKYHFFFVKIMCVSFV